VQYLREKKQHRKTSGIAADFFLKIGVLRKKGKMLLGQKCGMEKKEVSAFLPSDRISRKTIFSQVKFVKEEKHCSDFYPHFPNKIWECRTSERQNRQKQFSFCDGL
jgi:hypothetical protein